MTARSLRSKSNIEIFAITSMFMSVSLMFKTFYIYKYIPSICGLTSLNCSLKLEHLNRWAVLFASSILQLTQEDTSIDCPMCEVFTQIHPCCSHEDMQFRSHRSCPKKKKKKDMKGKFSFKWWSSHKICGIGVQEWTTHCLFPLVYA